MHNAQVADLDTESVDKHINKGLRRTPGLIDSVQLRCDLGILPTPEIVVHRSAVYYLWHLRRRAWFKQCLPDLAHLQSIQRLTSMILQYSSLQLCDIDRLEYDQWRLAVKHAILKRAQTF